MLENYVLLATKSKQNTEKALANFTEMMANEVLLFSISPFPSHFHSITPPLPLLLTARKCFSVAGYGHCTSLPEAGSSSKKPSQEGVKDELEHTGRSGGEEGRMRR